MNACLTAACCCVSLRLRACECVCIAVQAACTLAHLLGLFRLDPGESLLSLGYRGALADVLLWGFTRIQTHMFASDTYDR